MKNASGSWWTFTISASWAAALGSPAIRSSRPWQIVAKTLGSGRWGPASGPRPPPARRPELDERECPQLEVGGVAALFDDPARVAARPPVVDDARPGVRVEAARLAMRGLGGVEQPAVAAGVDEAREDLGVVRILAREAQQAPSSRRASGPSPTGGARRACARPAAPGRARAPAGSTPRPAPGSRGVLEVVLRDQPVAAAELGPRRRERGVGVHALAVEIARDGRLRPVAHRPRWRAGRTRRRGRSRARPRRAARPRAARAKARAPRRSAGAARPAAGTRRPSTTAASATQTSVPTGASTSCVVTRSWSPARSSVPMSAWSTSACGGERLQVGRSRSAKRATAALERITTDGSPASEADTASASAKERKSISGSGRSSRNGSTASRVSGRATARPAPQRRRARPRSSSSSIAAADARAARSGASRARAGSGDRAPTTAASPASAGGSSCSVADSTSTAVRAEEGGPARERLVEDRADREEIGARVGLLPEHLLRRHVARACRRAGPGASAPCRPRAPASARVGSGRARPKSSSFTPCGVRKVFEGFRSRWSVAASSWSACERGEHPAARAAAPRRAHSGPRLRRSASDSPSSSSIAMKSCPPSSPIS